MVESCAQEWKDFSFILLVNGLFLVPLHLIFINKGANVETIDMDFVLLPAIAVC